MIVVVDTLRNTTLPIRVTILLLDGSSLMTFASVLDPMRAANRLAQSPLFSWNIVTIDANPAVLTSGTSIEPDRALDASAQGDLLIIVAGFNPDRYFGRQYLTMLRACAPRFRVIVGVEAGAWVLAKAGLLDNRSATTHWEDLEDFQNAFARISVLPDRCVIDTPFITTGGASPSFDLMLDCVRVLSGDALAMEVASVFIYDAVHSRRDAQPVVSLGHLNAREPRIAAAIRIMEEYLDEPLPIAEIAARVGVSVRSLEVLFKRELALTPMAYFRYIRLQSARRLVIDTRLPMREIAIRTGFNSLAVFSRAFKEQYAQSPQTYRRVHSLDNTN